MNGDIREAAVRVQISNEDRDKASATPREVTFVRPNPKSSAATSFILPLFGILTVLHYGQAVLIPLTFALLVTCALLRCVRFGSRWGLNTSLSASIILSVIVGIILLGVYSLSDPVTDWAGRAPKAVAALEGKLKNLRAAFRDVQLTAAQLDNATSSSPSRGVAAVSIRPPTLSERLFTLGTGTLTSIGLFVLFLFAFLAYGDELLRSPTLPRWVGINDADWTMIVSSVERDVSEYLLLIAAINIVLGVVQGFVTYMAGLPNPILWGTLACILNFVPYVGSILGFTAVSAASLLTHNAYGDLLLAPLLYLSIDTLEGAVITPLIVGRRFRINPALGITWLVGWSWLWGPIGGIVAMPLLFMLRIFTTRVSSHGRAA